jgi:serine protease inhibitor
MKKFILYCVFLGSVAFLPVGPEKRPGRKRPDRKAPAAFTLSHNRFAFRLLDAVLAEDTGSSNKLISPLNLYLSIAMLYNGAAHDTRDSIAEALQVSDIGVSDLNARCKELQQQMPLEDNEVEFSMAGSIWYNQKRLTTLPAFENIADQYYYSPVQALNFSSRAAAVRINQWVDQNTHHRIPAIIENTSPGDAMYLLNALYFKSDWQQPFEAMNTDEEIFHLPGGRARAVPFMRKTAVIRTFSDTSFTMVELPYGHGGSYSLYVLLPEDDKRPVSGWAAGLDPDKLNNALAKMTDQPVELSLPRWEYAYSIGDLRPVLSRLGMGIAFAPPGESDFSNLYTDGARKACISQAVHKTCIRVNEKGTEAAAVTAGEVSFEGHMPIPHPRVIRADHPFLYLLMEKQQSLFLLAGIVNDPSLRGSSAGHPAGLRR